MRLKEARTYFSVLKELYHQQKAASPAEARNFIQEEKGGTEFRRAFIIKRVLTSKRHNPQLQEEIERATQTGQTVTQLDSEISTISPAKYKEWVKLRDQTTDFNRSFKHVAERVHQTQTKDHLAAQVIVGSLSLGLRLGSYEVYEKMKKVITGLGLENKAKDFLEAMEIMQIGALLVKQNGRSLVDFFQTDFRKLKDTKEIIEYVKMLMGFVNSKYKFERENIEIDTGQKLFKQYPYLTHNVQVEAGYVASSIYHIRAETVLQSNKKSPLPESISEASKKTFDFFKNVDEFKKRVGNLLFNPDDSNFEKAKEAFTSYLINSNKFITEYALNLMGVRDGESLKSAYRKAQIFVSKNIHPEFYGLILNELKEILDRSERVSISTVEDLKETVNSNVEIGKEVSSPDLKNLISQLLKLKGWHKLEIPELDIDWDKTGFTRPSSYSLKIEPTHPYELSFTFNYDYGQQDVSTYKIDVDTAKGTFDWSVLQAPQLYPDLKKRYLYLAAEFLQKIKEKTEDLLRENKSTKEQKPQPSLREKRIASYMPREKRQEPAEPKPNGSSSPLFTAENLPDTPKIINIIEKPDEEMYSGLKGAPPGIIEAIKEKLEGVNRGDITPSPLISKGPDGQKQAKLRTGDYRVILMEKEFIKGKRTWEIRWMENRRIVYDHEGMIKKL